MGKKVIPPSLEETVALFDFLRYDVVGIAVRMLPEAVRVKFKPWRLHPKLYVFKEWRPKELARYRELFLFLVVKSDLFIGDWEGEDIHVFSAIFKRYPKRLKRSYSGWQVAELDGVRAVRVPSYGRNHVLFLIIGNHDAFVTRVVKRRRIADAARFSGRPLFKSDRIFLTRVFG